MLGFGNARPGWAAVTPGAACDGDLDVRERCPAGLCRRAYRRPDGARGDRAAPCLCDCAGDEDTGGTDPRDARETAATRTTSAGARG